MINMSINKFVTELLIKKKYMDIRRGADSQYYSLKFQPILSSKSVALHELKKNISFRLNELLKPAFVR